MQFDASQPPPPAAPPQAAPTLPPPPQVVAQQPMPYATPPNLEPSPKPRRKRRRVGRWLLIVVLVLLAASVVIVVVAPPEEEAATTTEPEAAAVPSSAPEEAASTSSPDVDVLATQALRCEAGQPPIPFDTALGSCEEAILVGAELAVTTGLATAPETPAAILAFTTSCWVLQGSETKMFSIPETFDLAVALHDAGVCPGDVDLLVPA